MGSPPESNEIRFEWDPLKNAANIAKHGLSFENVVGAFANPMLRRRDQRRDYGEERWIALGRLGELTIVVVYTTRKETVRIISARVANRHEKKIFQDAAREKGP